MGLGISVNLTAPYQFLADVVLITHVAIVVFVVAGLVFIIVGNLRAWRLANALWFRLLHLVAIVVVVVQAWLGEVCPLTTFEMWLRTKARETTYSGSFIEHWLSQLLYYAAPSWVFTLVYTLFGLAVLAAWRYFPPRSKKKRNDHDDQPLR